MANSMKRLQNELKQCQTQLDNMQVAELENLKWRVTLTGTPGTPYEGGKFNVLVTFPTDYPFKFPDFKFETPIFHPNIDEKGEICKDMIGEKDWVPTKKIMSVLQFLVSLFSDVNENALNQEANQLYTQNREAFNKKAREYTDKHAK